MIPNKVPIPKIRSKIIIKKIKFSLAIGLLQGQTFYIL